MQGARYHPTEESPAVLLKQIFNFYVKLWPLQMILSKSFFYPCSKIEYYFLDFEQNCMGGENDRYQIWTANCRRKNLFFRLIQFPTGYKIDASDWIDCAPLIDWSKHHIHFKSRQKQMLKLLKLHNIHSTEMPFNDNFIHSFDPTSLV